MKSCVPDKHGAVRDVMLGLGKTEPLVVLLWQVCGLGQAGSYFTASKVSRVSPLKLCGTLQRGMREVGK